MKWWGKSKLPSGRKRTFTDAHPCQVLCQVALLVQPLPTSYIIPVVKVKRLSFRERKKPK